MLQQQKWTTRSKANLKIYHVLAIAIEILPFENKITMNEDVSMWLTYFIVAERQPMLRTQ